MRTSIAALLVLFDLLFFAYSAAAQSSAKTSQPQQQTPQKPLSSGKLLPPPPATQIPLLANGAGSANGRTITPPEFRDWIAALQNQKNGFAMDMRTFGGSADAPNCAHIRIIQAPETDSEMVVQMAPGDGGPIQTFQGLPPCSRDLPAATTAQRFYGVPPEAPVPQHRPFAQPPARVIPSAQLRPVQPKPNDPDTKP